MHLFEDLSADQVWAQAADAILDKKAGVAIQSSRCGPTRELLHVLLIVRDPRQRWLVSRLPVPNPAFAIAESLWILAGRNDAAFPTFWNPLLPKFQGEGPTYHGAYGHRLRTAFGIDQIERAFQALRANPETRQVVLEIFHPAMDLPDEGGHAVSMDVPCNVCSLLKIRAGRLEWVQIMRSNDLLRGLPYNLVQFTILQEVMAGWLGVEPGPYHHLSDSLHAYEKDLTAYGVSDQPTSLLSSDHLGLPKGEWETVFWEVMKSADELRSDEITRDRFSSLTFDSQRPEGYQNLFTVVAADAARRRRWPDLASEALSACTNPLLQRACGLWFDHCATSRR